MSFAPTTSGRATGRPIELYEFSFGPRNLDVRRYTDAEFPVQHGGFIFEPIPVSRAIITNNGTLDKSSMEITLPGSLYVPQMFRVYPPAQEVSLVIYQGEAEDSASEYIPMWHGRVLTCTFSGIEATLACEPISTTFGRVALRRHYQYMCPHMLYGTKCKAEKLAATSQVTVHTAAAREIVLTTELVDPNRYLGGSVEWFGPTGLLEARMVLSISSVDNRSVLLLSGVVRDLQLGSQISLILGCQHTEESCSTLHNNILNFGGMPWIPKQNPVGATSVY